MFIVVIVSYAQEILREVIVKVTVRVRIAAFVVVVVAGQGMVKII